MQERDSYSGVYEGTLKLTVATTDYASSARFGHSSVLLDRIAYSNNFVHSPVRALCPIRLSRLMTSNTETTTIRVTDEVHELLVKEHESRHEYADNIPYYCTVKEILTAENTDD